jgi:uncharacterized protein
MRHPIRLSGLPGLWIRAIVVIAALLGAAAAHAEGRVALVIGNGAYRHVDALPNPPNDAADMAAALERLGFSVTLVANADFESLRKALIEFNGRARTAEMATLFYAGHGIEIGGENWLIPVDAELKSDLDVEQEAISLRAVMQAVASASRLGVIILDACRNNPFAARMGRTQRTRAVERGFARVEPAGNVLVAYAAKDGTTATDGSGRNSPFTAALLRHVETPGLEINFLFRRVRDDVMAATNREQQPFVYGSLSRETVYLKAAASTSAQPPSAGGADALIWPAIKDSGDPALFEDFLRKFPGSAFAPAARARLEELKAAGSRATARRGDAPSLVTDTGGLRPDLVTDCDRLAASPFDLQRPREVAGVATGKIEVQPAARACDEAMTRYPDVARFAYQAGRVADARGDYAGERAFMEKASALGSALAMNSLGLIHHVGLGVKQDFAEARRWYEKAVALGNTTAMINLGDLYESGRGVKKDFAAARGWYDKAAAAGDRRGMNNLGSLYAQGRGIRQDFAEARRWYEKSAALGDEIAMRNLGGLHERGQGVAKSLDEARKWYMKAAEAGDEEARKTLRRLK